MEGCVILQRVDWGNVAEGRNSCGLLATQQCAHSCHKYWAGSWISEHLLASEGLCPMELPTGSFGLLVSQSVRQSVSSQSAILIQTISTIQHWVAEIAVTDSMAGA